MVPEGWSQVRLGEVATFRNGLNFKKDSEGQLIRVVGVPHFWQRTILRDFNQVERVSVGRISNDDLLKSGDLLFVRSNGNKALIGRCLLFPEINEPVSFSGFTIRGRLNKQAILPDYFRSLAETKIVKDQISKGGGGTNISNLSQEVLSRVEIYLPPLPEQKKIADNRDDN